ncbi:hypothetical protein MTR_7g005460 [Medicago truncatula]|uniref:Uncharacterized protein n=1 Tax=Medicago truncatula TaxID=3880 RepID=G7KWK8_MEDTR|nr:hypothetical protein MTR_7g005460 [Medicago truncatula]
MGCLFFMLSMVNVIEIRLWMLSCGSKSAAHVVAVMAILVSSVVVMKVAENGDKVLNFNDGERVVDERGAEIDDKVLNFVKGEERGWWW